MLKGGVMSTHALERRTQHRVRVRLGLSSHWAWLARGFVLAFALPFLLAGVPIRAALVLAGRRNLE